MLLHDCQGRSTPRAGGRLSIYRRSRIEIVTHHQRRPDPVLHAHQRCQRHGNLFCIEHLELFKRLMDILSMTAIGLKIDLPRSSEAVKIIDVVGSQLNLQRVEKIFH